MKKLNSCTTVVQAEFLLHHYAPEVVQYRGDFEFYTRNYSEFQNCYKKTGGAWCHHYGADMVQTFQNHYFIQKVAKLDNCMNNHNVLICNHHCEVCELTDHKINSPITQERYHNIILRVENFIF